MSPQAPARRQWQSLALAGTGVVALLGAGLATLDLLRGVQEANALYAIGIAGLSIEGDLQDFTQESRRTFVYALTTGDPNLQLPFIEQARSAEKRVNELCETFRKISKESGTFEELAIFGRQWKEYLSARDEVISFILEGRASEALEFERVHGAPAFEICAYTIHELKHTLDAYAQRQLARIRQRYLLSALEIAFLMLTMLLFMGSFRKLATLRKTNKILAEAERLERERSGVLELISGHQSMSDVFAALARLVEGHYAGEALCSLRLLRGDVLVCAAGPSLPEEYIGSSDNVDVADSPTSFACAARTASPCFETRVAEIERWPRADLLISRGVLACWSIPIFSGKGLVLGTLTVYVRQAREPREDELTFLSRIARLATLAVEHRQVIDQLAFQARHDALTGLPNRILLHERFTDVLTGDRRPCLSILCVDLDRFKQVNDGLGHHVGDLLLQEIARRLSLCVRENDVVARIGGDEFVILLLRDSDTEIAPFQIGQRVVESLGRPMTFEEHEIAVTASVGLSCYPEHGENVESLLRNADTAMYRAKFQGRNMCEVYKPEMGSDSTQRLEIESHIRGALQNDEFQLYYQPQVRPDGTIVGVEALIRWDSPVLGRVPPSDFIPIAEESNLIVSIGNWVLQKACSQAAAWNADLRSPLPISVNVSPNQFVRPEFADVVVRALESGGLDPTLLVLEVTETAMMRYLQESVAHLTTLREMGVRISLDDFGTGNSSLAYLRQLPVDTLKIDQSFIKDIDSAGHESVSVVRAIIGLAHGLRLSVVAEGVENPEQLRILSAEHCDVIQGFYFHRPMPARALGELLDRLPGPNQEFARQVAHLGEALTGIVARANDTANGAAVPVI